MAHNSTVFGQLLKLVSRREFDALAGKHKSRKLYHLGVGEVSSSRAHGAASGARFKWIKQNLKVKSFVGTSRNIPGLAYVPDFLDEAHERRLVEWIDTKRSAIRPSQRTQSMIEVILWDLQIDATAAPSLTVVARSCSHVGRTCAGRPAVVTDTVLAG